MRTPERLRSEIALHECAHAAMAYLLGRPAHLVTIRPTETYYGVASYRSQVPKDADMKGLGDAGVVLLNARLRRIVETSVCISLAGPAADDLLRPLIGEELRSGFRGERSDEVTAKRDVEDLIALTEGERSYLRRLEATPERLPSDIDSALEIIKTVENDESAALVANYFQYLNSVTRTIVVSPVFVDLCMALHPELIEHETVGGRRIRAIFQEAETQKRTTMLKKKKSAFDPGKFYVALQSFTCKLKDGSMFTIRAGREVRGDHEVLERLPEWFIWTGASPEDKRKAKHAVGDLDLRLGRAASWHRLPPVFTGPSIQSAGVEPSR